MENSSERGGGPGTVETDVIRSSRRTFALEVRPGRVTVRAPARATDQQIQAFLAGHQEWIDRALARQAQRKREAEEEPRLTGEEIRALADRALAYIPARVAHYAPLVGVSYGRVTIRNQRSRWGSCSARGNLNFNCLLMLTPPEVIDSVVVHELCHRKEMNHSARFYAEVLRVYPEYRKWDRWLKENGRRLMDRMVGF